MVAHFSDVMGKIPFLNGVVTNVNPLEVFNMVTADRLTHAQAKIQAIGYMAADTKRGALDDLFIAPHVVIVTEHLQEHTRHSLVSSVGY